MGNILIVEDEAAILKSMVAALSKTGHTLLTASDGTEALKLMGIEGGAPGVVPDVIIMDVMMPNVNGYMVLKKMHEHAGMKGVPVILITGYTELKDVFQQFKNVQAFLAKPLDPKRLLNSLADALPSAKAEG